MSNDDEKSLEELEQEYKDTLEKKIASMKKSLDSDNGEEKPTKMTKDVDNKSDDLFKAFEEKYGLKPVETKDEKSEKKEDKPEDKPTEITAFIQYAKDKYGVDFAEKPKELSKEEQESRDKIVKFAEEELGLIPKKTKNEEFEEYAAANGYKRIVEGEGMNDGAVSNRETESNHKFVCSTINQINTEKKIDKEAKFLNKFASSRLYDLGQEKKSPLKFASYTQIAESYCANGLVAFTDSDDGCEDNVDDWEVADCFADVIWQDVICRSNFAGRITVRGLDFKAGCGGKVQIRTINVADPSSDFGAMSPCTCLSCVSNSFSTYTLTMEVYGDYKVLCDLDLFTAGDVVKTAVMKSMSARAAERVDYKIFSELEAATPTYKETLTSGCGGSRLTDGDCCTYAVDLYDKIIDLEAQMREAGYFQNADPILILSPSVAAYLKYKDGLNMPAYIASQIRMNGIRLAGIGQIDVIESCHANSCTDDSGEEIAILIDPERAIGEAWGKRPTFKVDDDPIECGSQKVVLRMWADFAVLDTGAVGHIENP